MIMNIKTEFIIVTNIIMIMITYNAMFLMI